MTLPDFMIIGAMKCGTSTLQAQLAAQPGIFMTDPKEPNFFSDDPIYRKGLKWYADLYKTAGPDDLKGEASTHYTKLPTYPETVGRIAKAVAAPRLIYLIRNPFDRAISHYIHEWSQGVISGDPDTALGTNPEIIDYGRYAMQLQPFIDTFGKDAVFLTSLEEMKSDPQHVLSEVGRFLGLSQELIWHRQADNQNVSAERIRKLPFHSLLVDNPIATFVRRNFIPQSARDRVKAALQMRERPAFSADALARLEQVYSKDRDALKRLFPTHDWIDDLYEPPNPEGV